MRKVYATLTAGGAIGLIASFLQSVEKINLLKHRGNPLACDLNSVFSCSNVLNAKQSSVFGFPNSFLCMVLFTIFMITGLVLLTGGQISRKLLLWIQGFSLFMLGFGLWFLWQSTYRIGSLCVFCVFCFAGLLMINWSFVRINQKDSLAKYIISGADTFGWILLGLIVAALMVLRFW